MPATILRRNQVVEVVNQMIMVDPQHYIAAMENPCKAVCQLNQDGDWLVRDNRGLFRVIPVFAIIPTGKKN